MNTQVSLRPPNSVLLFMPPKSGRVPESMNRQLVAATESCVAIGTLSEADGESTIVLDSGSLGESWPLEFLVFDGKIETPEKHVALVTAFNEVLVELETSSTVCRLRVFANDESEPDRIFFHVVPESG